MEKISIIDHTGVKVAMEKYSDPLAVALTTLNHPVYIFSNFAYRKPLITYYDIFESKHSNPLKRLVLRIYGYIKAAVISRKKGADYIFIHLFELTLISFLQHLIVYVICGNKIITIYHDISAFGKKDKKWLAKFILVKFTKKLIVHNNYSKDYLLETFTFVNQKDVIIMKHGHYNSFVNNTKNDDIPGTIVNINNLKADGKKILLFFGQIKAEKGLDILLEALTQLPPNVILIIAGRVVTNFDTYTNFIEKNNLGQRVITYLRYIQDMEMDYLVQNIDLVVLPYKKIFQSGVLLNIMSQQSLVLASDLEPNTDILKDGVNGFTFKSESATDLAKKIAEIFDTPLQTLQQIKTNGHSTVMNDYDWDKIAEKLVADIKQ